MAILQKVLFISVVTLAGLFLVPGCKSAKVKIPSDIIPEKKMQAVMIDVLTAESYSGMHSIQPDTNRKITARLYTQIFDKYHITKDEYFKSYNYYAAHPSVFEKDMVVVIDSLNAIEARIPAGYNRINVPMSGPKTVRSN